MSFATQFKGRKAPSVGFTKPSTVQPHFRNMCDVNRIVERALRGDATALNACRMVSHDVDITNLPDTLHAALQQSVAARNAYELLAPEIKAKYPTPEAFFAACHDSTQIESLRACGAIDTPPADIASAESVTPQGA